MFKRLAAAQFLLLLFQTICYFGCEKLQKNPHDVKKSADERIPFLPWTVGLYCLWFPLIVLFPLALYYADPSVYVLYITTTVFEIIISVLCYLICPTTFERPVPPDTFWGKCMKLVYFGSYRGLNCAPSLHCSTCYLVIFTAACCGSLPMWIRLAAVLIAALIVMSTLTTRQHVLIDVLTAIPLFGVCLILGKSFPMTALAGWIAGT